MKKMLLLALLVLLPCCALAVTEGVVEAAPQVEMDSVGAADAQVSYLPDESYYLGYGDWQPEWAGSETYVPEELVGECYEDVTQIPGLTQGEIARAKMLLASYQAGEAAGDGARVLGAKENVVVGVYALDPAEYDGEQVFVLLPGTNLTDEQLLAVIDAYAQLGLTFDPEALNYRNCARGGGIECTRFLTQEERERYDRLASLIERGLLDVTGLDATDVLRPKLDGRYFCNMQDFTFRPYRAMTDEELCAMLVEVGFHDMSGEFDLDDVEKRSRQALYDMLGCPLSMELENVFFGGGYVPMVADAQGNCDWPGEGRSGYGAHFSYHNADGIFVYAYTMFDRETGELVAANAMHDRGSMDEEPAERGITQEEIAAATAQMEEQLGLSDLDWHVMTEERTATNWGSCMPVRAQVSPDMWMTIHIGTDDGQAHGWKLERGTLVDQLPEEPENNG